MKLRSIVAAASLALFAGPAFAQSDIVFEINGTIPDVCGAENLSIASVNTLILNGVEQALGTIKYTCNDPEGFTRTITSANGGTLNDASGNEIPYTLSHGGISEIAFGPNDFTDNPITTNVPSSSAVMAGVQGVVSAAAGPVTGLPGGLYTDTVTIAVTAN